MSEGEAGLDDGEAFRKVRQRITDQSKRVVQTKEILSKQAVQTKEKTKEILSKQAVKIAKQAEEHERILFKIFY
ncbi:putative membrane protein [Cocos nucifera]|uniref:Putative membrane protein n=1 Tax=Cocos nucifera TaxID=13894 RepID=A0A8K0I9M4_COCNU|nr:putative membrane protein [Cocos nucifera]